MESTIDHDRETVRRLLLEAEQRLRADPDAEASNAAVDAAVEIADRWHAEGRIVDLLAPLLNDAESKRFRYNVASVLLHRGHPEIAVPALESAGIAEAKVILRHWRRQQAPQG